MGLPKYGAKKIELGDWDPVTGTSSNWVEVPVYNATFNMAEGEPSVTEHKQQGKSSPRLRRSIPASIPINFQLMDTDPDSLAAAGMGTVTTVEGVKSFHMAKNRGEVIKSLRILVEDDSVVYVPAFSHYARMNFNTAENSIHVIDVAGVVTDSGDEDIADLSWSDPIPPAGP